MEFQNGAIADIWRMIRDQILTYARVILNDEEMAEKVVIETEDIICTKEEFYEDTQKVVLEIRKVFWERVMQVISVGQGTGIAPDVIQKGPLDEMITEAVKGWMKKNILEN